MFAIPTHPYSCQPFASAQTHPTLYDLDYDLLAPYSYHQRQAVIEEQARRDLLARRCRQQEYEEQQAALAYRAAVLRQLELQEGERQYVEAQRQARLREQLRQQEEQRFTRENSRRTVEPGPTLFALLFDAPLSRAAPSQPTDDRPTALPAPPGIPLDFRPPSTPTSEPASAADPPSPTLPTFVTSAREAYEDNCHSIASSSDTHSSTSSVSVDESSLSPSERASALSTLATLATSLDSRRSAFSTSFDPSSLVFRSEPESTSSSAASSQSTAPALAFTSSNAPFLAHEDFLVTLLSKVDAVESQGDREIRSRRKDLVREVEAELKKLDEMRGRVWAKQVALEKEKEEEEEDEEEAKGRHGEYMDGHSEMAKKAEDGQGTLPVLPAVSLPMLPSSTLPVDSEPATSILPTESIPHHIADISLGEGEVGDEVGAVAETLL
ncbi:hypothetical protein JCM11641_001148 [Rhodosporidiobolus odoratus]